MRFNFQALVNFTLILIFALGLIIFVFWRFGIFKKEADLGTISNIKTQIDFVSSYPYQNLTSYLQNLPTTKIEIPGINSDEIGRPGLF
jgi:uncharacterized membrane protein